MRRHASQVGLHFKPISEFLFPEISLCDETPLYIGYIAGLFWSVMHAVSGVCVCAARRRPVCAPSYDCKPRSALDTQAGTQVQWQCVCDLVCVSAYGFHKCVFLFPQPNAMSQSACRARVRDTLRVPNHTAPNHRSRAITKYGQRGAALPLA